MPPPNRQRHDALADGALQVLARKGARGLTHRAVDAESRAPSGTASRYFPSRDDLLTGITERLLERQIAMIGELKSTPLDADQLPGRVARNIRDILTARPEHAFALFELYLEGVRRPRLRQALAAATQARGEAVLRQCHAAGVRLSEKQAALLVMMSNGIVLTTIATEPDDLTGVEPMIHDAVQAVVTSAQYGG